MDSDKPNRIPGLIYGTADQPTSRRVGLHVALSIGYNAVDTASNYSFDEAAVSAALSLHATGKQVHVQTKYSSEHFWRRSKDPPYNTNDNIPLQVLKSVAASISKLETSPIDVLLLHRPFVSIGKTYAAWEVFEEIYRQGGANNIGICQVDIATLRLLFTNANIKPSVVQNAFAFSNDYDKEVRRFCRDNGIVYQAFGVFAAENAALLEEDIVAGVAAQIGVETHAALLAVLWAMSRRERERFCVMDGSRDEMHLEENWKAYVVSNRGLEQEVHTFPTMLDEQPF